MYVSIFELLAMAMVPAAAARPRARALLLNWARLAAGVRQRPRRLDVCRRSLSTA